MIEIEKLAKVKINYFVSNHFILIMEIYYIITGLRINTKLIPMNWRQFDHKFSIHPGPI